MSQPNPSHSPAESKAVPEAGSVHASGWTEMNVKARWRPFPDPSAKEPVRIALSAEASADMIAHAKESLDKEVCGVLVGERCEDDRGTWVFAKAAIRGTASRQGGSHVTYTQETWEKIYEVKDRDYPKLDIVGWYHTHPGFGVEFSDMDKFIQQNFFAGALQFALVLDPLGGDEAICVNTPEGITYVDHYWLDGRARTCRVPRTGLPEPEGAAAAVSSGVESRLKAVEERLQQLLAASEEDRVAHHRFLLTVGMFVAMAVILWIGFNIYTGLTYLPEPPKINNWIPVPMKVGDDVVMVGLAVAEWKVPPELNAVYVELEKQRREAEAEKQKQEAARKAKPKASGAKPAADQGQPGAPAKKAAEHSDSPGSNDDEPKT